MQRKKEARQALESRRATAIRRSQILAQKRTDRFGLIMGAMMVASMVYVALCETGVL